METKTEVTKFNPEDLAKNLKERVKQEFVNLIPEAHWDKFIADTVKEFTEKDLKDVIKEVLRTKGKERVVEYLNDNLKGEWDVTKQRTVMDSRMKEMIVSLAPTMLAEIMEQMITGMMQNMRNRMC
ncbi:MAG: hypothetical protein AABY22_23785 [Nanoarchaeota archaeon]